MLRIHDIVDTPGLGVVLAAGADGLQNRVRWVHVSELRDPTPWLEGGELLLRTGPGVGKSPAGHMAYVRRLASPGLAGLVSASAWASTPSRARSSGRPTESASRCWSSPT